MERVARISAGIIAVIAVGAIAFDVSLTLTRHPGTGLLPEIWRIMRYFTILTNLIVAVTCFRVFLGGPVSAVWAGGVALWIAIVGIVYHNLLARELSGLDWWPDFGLHYFVPTVFGLWWLAFAPKQDLKFGHALLWLIWPIVYVVYALGRGAMDGVYPYFFLNPVDTGWIGVLQWAAALCLGFFIGGVFLITVAKVITKARPHPTGVDLRGPRPQ